MAFPRNVRIVLVAPEYPGNVGSAARALFTMGLEDLHVVCPVCDPKCQEAYWLAHNSACVLDRLTIDASLEEALADTVFSVGTTRRVRRVGYQIFTPEETASLVAERGDSQSVAVVFGRESSGLTNEELALCSIQSTVPCAQDDHSLNLAQAVMIYCHALHRASLSADERKFEWNLATHVEMQHFYAHLAQTLERLALRPATTMESYLARFRRVIGRVPIESRDVRLFHKLLAKIDAAAGGQPQVD